MNEEAYHNRYGTDLWIRSDWIWNPELQMRSANVWDMTLCVIPMSFAIHFQTPVPILQTIQDDNCQVKFLKYM
jgi:hypothetical protein